MQAAGGVQRRLRQYEGLSNDDLALTLARRLVTAKIESQLRYMLRISRGNDWRNDFQEQIQTLRNMLKHSAAADSRDTLLGYEGIASKAYFACIALLTAPHKASGMAFEHRSKRPPENASNAVLSFMYSLLYRDCVQAIISVGLDPAIGFYHQPRSSAYPLAMDVMEMFRVPLVDMIYLGSVNRNQWVLEEDFTTAGKQVWLSDLGRKKAIQLYEARKQDTWKHPAIGYSLTYARHLELEVRLLEKEWSGRPGLFAVNRIR
jgi:CRISPR-associated protein Cas1